MSAMHEYEEISFMYYKPIMNINIILFSVIILFLLLSIGMCSEVRRKSRTIAYRWPHFLNSKQVFPLDQSGMGSLLIIRQDRLIHKGNIFRIPVFGALFFSSLDEIHRFKIGLYDLAGLRILNSPHVVRAEEDIMPESGGGKIFDPVMGVGFILFIPSNVDATMIMGPNFRVKFPRRLPFQIRRRSSANVIGTAHPSLLGPPQGWSFP